MAAYYNEIDPKAAAWLRELIKQGHIADGVVDERSIVDVTPDELAEFIQCHFFAGIGGWSLALRLAGWPDERPVWTGSCPCQPFSAAGARGGFDDQRHLWPHWHHLISQCRPSVVFGEQVASKDGLGWLDLVCADMEATGYAVGAADLCAAGIGAPHIRQRLWFVGLADADHAERGTNAAGWNNGNGHDAGRQEGAGYAEGRGSDKRLADATFEQHDGIRIIGTGWGAEYSDRCGVGRLADADGGDASAERQQRGGEHGQQPEDGGVVGLADADDQGSQGRAGMPKRAGELVAGAGGVVCGLDDIARPCPTNGFWRDADWLFCRDGKWRPVEPGTSPLAHGLPARVGRLRGYGNAISPQVAQTFIASVMEITTPKETTK